MCLQPPVLSMNILHFGQRLKFFLISRTDCTSAVFSSFHFRYSGHVAGP